MQQWAKAPICSGVACVKRMSDRVGICLAMDIISLHAYKQESYARDAHFSNSAKVRVSKVSSQPTSTRILIPPSNSRIDCEAFEGDDCAPRSGVKVNMLAVSNGQRRALRALDGRNNDLIES